MEYIMKIVKFGDYCDKCKYKGTSENDEPCETCVSNTVKEHSNIPIKYEEDK